MKKALVVVDMQKDFIYGSLGNDECKAVVPKVVDLIKSGDYDWVIATRDLHNSDYLDTQEGRKLPVEHCIIDTDGWMLVDAVEDAIRDGKFESHAIDKSTFGSLVLADFLKDVCADYDEVHFCGVCTGICVISNVAIAKAALSETKICVIKDACACVTPDSHERAIEAMRTFQIDII